MNQQHELSTVQATYAVYKDGFFIGIAVIDYNAATDTARAYAQGTGPNPKTTEGPIPEQLKDDIKTLLQQAAAVLPNVEPSRP